jgi:cbb3-type cytochrome oxidase maturation protein
MSVILILILASLAVALAFLAGFIWAVRAGQFEDTCTPAMRILSEDETVPTAAGRDVSPKRPCSGRSGRLGEASLPYAHKAPGAAER